jgi:hypothetical protein
MQEQDENFASAHSLRGEAPLSRIGIDEHCSPDVHQAIWRLGSIGCHGLFRRLNSFVQLQRQVGGMIAHRLGRFHCACLHLISSHSRMPHINPRALFVSSAIHLFSLFSLRLPFLSSATGLDHRHCQGARLG